jgi:hypothetical protein
MLRDIQHELPFFPFVVVLLLAVLGKCVQWLYAAF